LRLILRQATLLKNQYEINNEYREYYGDTGAVAVLVYNGSNKIQILSQSYLSNGFNMIQEALDKDGQWKPIEFMFDFVGCGTGHYDYKVLPKHYIASGIIKYAGNFKTKLRVKIESMGNFYYSDSFDGTINRSQFNQDFVPQFLKDNDRWFDGKGYYYEATIALMFLGPMPTAPN
jgi:hypothetical protein